MWFPVILVLILVQGSDSLTVGEQQGICDLIKAWDPTGWGPCDQAANACLGWPGIVCDATTRSTIIQLTTTTAFAPLPPSIGNFKGLQYLYCPTFGPIPTTIGLLSNLTLLYLRGGETRFGVSSIPTQMMLLTSLKILDFQFAYSTIPKQIGKLVNLNTLNLLNGQLNGTIPTQIGLLRSLVLFQSDSVSLRGTIPTELGLLTSLSTLLLTSSLNGTLPSHFGRLTGLASVRLPTTLSGPLPTQIGRLTRLNYFVGGTFSSIPPQIANWNVSMSSATFYATASTLPTEIGLWTRCNTLIIKSPLVTIPTQIENMRTLRYLTINTEGKLQSLPTGLGSLPLLTLDVNNGALQTLPDFKRGNQQINFISANFNNFSTFPTGVFFVRSLTNLLLRGNDISVISPDIGSLKLNNLDLAFNSLLTLPSEFGSLLRLQSLSISNNFLPQTIPQMIVDIGPRFLDYFPQNCDPTKPQNCGDGQFCGLKTPQSTVYECRCYPGYSLQVNGTASFCGDVNECVNDDWSILKSNNTGAPCVNPFGSSYSVCVNSPGSFSCCPPGLYNPDPNLGSTCTDMNECLSDFSTKLPSANTKAPCAHPSLCVNQYGGFSCCAAGYYDPYPQIITDLSVCRDINECLYLKSGASCSVPSNQNVILNSSNTQGPCAQSACVNSMGSFYCCPSGFINPDISRIGDLSNCEDVNECLDFTFATLPSRNTKSTCASQQVCVNEIGSFLCCPDGFRNPNISSVGTLNNCEDINECLDFSFAVRPSTNTKKPCLNQYSCINTAGSFLCCPPGYENDNTVSIGTLLNCVDINECSPSAREKVTCPTNHFCLNTPGSYQCTSCDDPGVMIKRKNADSDYFFPSLQDFRSLGFSYKYCYGTCSSGVYFFDYVSSEASVCSRSYNISSLLCSYACANLTTRKTAQVAIDTLMEEFQRGRFLDEVLSKIFSMDIRVTYGAKKRANTLSISLSNCPTNQDQLRNVLQGLVVDITPNAPAVMLQVSPSCSIQIQSTDPLVPTTDNAQNLIGPIVGAVVGFLVLLAILIGYLLYRRRTLLDHLPAEVAWSFRLHERSFDWEYRGTKLTGYYYFQFGANSSEYRRCAELFYQHGENPMEIRGITAVYNPVLIRNFVGTYLIQSERARSDPHLFASKRWTSGEATFSDHSWVYEKYVQLTQKYSWNKGSTAMILPAFHGTDLALAEKICETGFANLSLIDAGYFGRGIYFTTFPMYCLPYIGIRKYPALILSYILPGNVYPCTECHTGKESLMGTAIKSGYNSHFIVTKKSGRLMTGPSKDPVFNEFVLGQEAQIVPAFIFELESDVVQKEAIRWHRVLPSELPLPTGPPPIPLDMSESEEFVPLDKHLSTSFADHF